MTRQEKIEIMADVLEVEVDEIKDDNNLDDYEAWDSVAVLAVISVMNEKFNRFPHADEIKGYKTIGDLIAAMHE